MSLTACMLAQIERRAPGDVHPAETVQEGTQEPKQEEGMRLTPDVVLFLGAVALTVVLGAVLFPFLRRILREDDRARAAGRDRPGGGGA